MDLIEIKGLSKGFQEGLFRKQTILQNIDLTVRQGDFVVLRGANGAGKSTLIKIILGLQDPDSGSVQLFGASPHSPESKLQIGTVFQEVTPPNSLKVRELIELVRSYYPNPLSTKDVLETVGLTDKQNAFPSDLAGGQKQRLYFAIALVGNPKLLILDEPTKNLDVEGQKVFWGQVERCRSNGVTVLMVTHIQSEQDRLQDLATHIITLVDGKLNFDKQPTQAAPTEGQTSALSPSLSANPFQMLIKQSWAEILQLFRTPTYLAGVFLFSSLAAILPFEKDMSMIQKGLIFFSAISLLIFSVERLGKRIAIERVEGWLKLLRVTPLPPSIYLAAKLVMTMLVLIASLSIIFAIGIFKFGLHQSLTQWLALSAGLLLGIIPFAIIGITLGYVIPPKALDSIAGILIPFGIFSCGLVPIQEPSYVKDLIVLSPFFHYRQIIQYGAGMAYDKHLLLHVLWLIFYAVVAGLIAKLAYQRDNVAQ
ncbi:ABC transporter ATP-binding protein/permease [Leptolyngbya sp. FACHB-321]|uniref:ABC transporter ATP-binding protein/permease n=1 Tax=Leptolyngbya sp. FACHB-321 TaxID=2692807 RepID=UPI0016894E2A|nr:ABC transporter ATP-binding protein/permease [Leptolyngbya sp. FACHB-321]MBD2036578.1 ABC transporter ATP-binding protein/permease [Leptolyngbya sp. FACHB-321]